MKSALVLILCLCSFPAQAQNIPDTLSLNYFYEQIPLHVPAVQKQEIQQKITALNTKIARSGFFPSLTISAGASYQSAVTEVPFAPPGMAPQFSKDHYNISLDLSQPLFDAGKTRIAKELETLSGVLELTRVEAELWHSRAQIEQVYFSALLLQKRKESLALLIEHIGEQITVLEKKVKAGLMLPGTVYALQAERIKAKQQFAENEQELKAAHEILGILINSELPPQVVLAPPQIQPAKKETATATQNPELKALMARQQLLKTQENLAKSGVLPTVAAFAKAAYGRPGLNAFDNDLQPYWMIGLRARWDLKSAVNSGKKTEILRLQQRKTEADQREWLRQMEVRLEGITYRIKALEENLLMDEELLDLHRKIVQEKEHQLNEGAATATEYILELNAENRTKLNLEIRQLQLLQAIIEYHTIKGISWN